MMASTRAMKICVDSAIFFVFCILLPPPLMIFQQHSKDYSTAFLMAKARLLWRYDKRINLKLQFPLLHIIPAGEDFYF